MLALAALSVPPISVAATSDVPGHPSAAITIDGTVVTSSSSMMRGFVSLTYARTPAPIPRRTPVASAVPAVTT